MTIKDLAKKTGYGVATVSRVLNNQPNVSEKAWRTIMQAAQQNNFQINVNAKHLKQQHATSILVVVKGTSNEMFAEMVETIQSIIAKTAYPLFVDYQDEDEDEVRRAVQLCRERKPRGILFLGGNRENFLASFDKIDIPCVLVSNDASELPFANLSSVSTDDRQAACCAIDTLVALGHRDFAIIGGDRTVSDTSRLRYEGCLQSFHNHNISFDEALNYQVTRFSYQGGYDATKKLLSHGRKFTALFAAADVMAIGAIRALRDCGLRVPEDVSVVGFDGLPLSGFLVPQLSTVAQSVTTMAQRSVEILLSCLEEGSAACHETVPFSIYQRESTQRLD